MHANYQNFPPNLKFPSTSFSMAPKELLCHRPALQLPPNSVQSRPHPTVHLTPQHQEHTELLGHLQSRQHQLRLQLPATLELIRVSEKHRQRVRKKSQRLTQELTRV